MKNYLKMNNIKTLSLFSVILVYLFCSGCNHQSKTHIKDENNKILTPDTKIITPSYKDLFSRMELINLETNSEFLISNIDKATVLGDTIIIFDRFQSKIGLFNSKGDFIHLIGEKGQGPGEYITIYDFSFNPFKNIISLISPFGDLYNFKLNGEFINKINLPVKHNYLACCWLNENSIVLWSAVEEDESGITLYDTNSQKILYEDWYNDRMIDMTNLNPFFKVENSVYFAAPFSFSIYEITNQKMVLSYIWDFKGKYIPPSYIDNVKSIADTSKKNQKLIDDVDKGKIEFPFFNGANTTFYYIALCKKIGDKESILNIFYNKISTKSISFRNFNEGLSLKPLFMNDEFILGIVSPDEYNLYLNLMGLNGLNEEFDNPVLVKYYFKK